jgi:hypothetical protein
VNICEYSRIPADLHERCQPITSDYCPSEPSYWCMFRNIGPCPSHFQPCILCVASHFQTCVLCVTGGCRAESPKQEAITGRELCEGTRGYPARQCSSPRGGFWGGPAGSCFDVGPPMPTGADYQMHCLTLSHHSAFCSGSFNSRGTETLFVSISGL